MIQIKRVYEPPKKEDGARILIDRLWPRGVSKESAKINLWLKEIAPSPALRIWFSHDPENFQEFRKRYRLELKKNKKGLSKIKEMENENKTIALLYGAKSPTYNHAVVLRDYCLGYF